VDDDGVGFDHRTVDSLFFNKSLTKKHQKPVDQELAALTPGKKIPMCLKSRVFDGIWGDAAHFFEPFPAGCLRNLLTKLLDST
jgi:hypothetical protein